MIDDERPIRSLADIEALEALPLEERISERSTYDIIRNAAKRDPEQVAIHFLREGNADETPLEITYGQLFARVNQTANLLHELGLKKDEAVSYLLPNVPQAHFVIWGGEAAGIVNAINPLLNPRQIADIMEAANSTILVTLGPNPQTDIWEKAQEVHKLVPGLRTILCVGGHGGEVEGALDFDALLNTFPADKLTSGRHIGPHDIASYFHTGGTTGSPKLAQHTHWGEIYQAWVLSRMVKMGRDDCLLLGLPLFHVNAVMVTGLAPFMAGSSTVMLSAAGYRNPSVIANFWKIVQRYRATFFSAVPTIYSALLDVPMNDTVVGSLRYAICGAAPMPVEVFREFERRTGITIIEGYGLTEGTTASCLNPPDGERRIGSIGIRFPYQEMKTVQVAADGRWVRDCAVDEQGVIVIKGPNVFPGYKQENFNRGIWADDGWFNTGDLGRQDEDGYFWLTGRAKDLIIRGGHNIDPAMIEEVLHEHPAVALTAAVGKPDSYAGEVPVAYVVLKPGVEISAGELQAHAKRTVAEPPAAPVDVFIIDDMPMTAVGKIFKPTLRHDAIRRVYESALAECGLNCTVTVAAHETFGVLATVRVEGAPPEGRESVEKSIAKALGAYAVRHQVEWV